MPRRPSPHNHPLPVESLRNSVLLIPPASVRFGDGGSPSLVENVCILQIPVTLGLCPHDSNVWAMTTPPAAPAPLTSSLFFFAFMPFHRVLCLAIGFAASSQYLRFRSLQPARSHFLSPCAFVFAVLYSSLLYFSPISFFNHRSVQPLFSYLSAPFPPAKLAVVYAPFIHIFDTCDVTFLFVACPF